MVVFVLSSANAAAAAAAARSLGIRLAIETTLLGDRQRVGRAESATDSQQLHRLHLNKIDCFARLNGSLDQQPAIETSRQLPGRPDVREQRVQLGRVSSQVGASWS